MSTYIVIGASSGIGFELSKLLLENGHQVCGTYCSSEELPQIDVEWYRLDVLEDSLDFSFLPDQIDGLAYCPGSIDLKPFKRIKPVDFQNDFNLQVVGAVNCIQAVLPKMKKSEGASIVLFSTVAVQMGFNFHTKVAVSKGAIEGLTRSLAAELAPKIRVNAIAPSITDTPLAAKLLSSPEKVQANADRHPLKKVGTPENIADAAQFLLSDKSNWITGQVLKVDGGISVIK